MTNKEFLAQEADLDDNLIIVRANCNLRVKVICVYCSTRDSDYKHIRYKGETPDGGTQFDFSNAFIVENETKKKIFLQNIR